MLFGLISADALAAFVIYVQNAGSVAPVIYAVTFTVATVACLPSSLIEIVSGFLFPFHIALAVNLSAKLTGALIAFILGKTACKDIVTRRAEKIKIVRAMRYALKTHANAFKLALLLRLSPAPIFVKNYGLGALELSLPNFITSTTISAIPMGIVWVLMGGAARDAGTNVLDLVSDDQPSVTEQLPSSVKFVLLAIGLIIMSLLALYIRRTFNEIIAEEEQAKLENSVKNDEVEGRHKTK
jgi:uncharacterized membrane protein YdjX (TVP38/TMEM64 family)